MNRCWNRSLETLDSDADLLSSAFSKATGSESESGASGSSPMSLAMTLVDRRCLSSPSPALSHLFAVRMDAFVRISLGWRPPLASTVALLSNESLGASLQNFHDVLVPSFNSNIWRGRGELGVRTSGDRSSGVETCLGRSGIGVAGCFTGCGFPNSPETAGEDFSDPCAASATWDCTEKTKNHKQWITLDKQFGGPKDRNR